MQYEVHRPFTLPASAALTDSTRVTLSGYQTRLGWSFGAWVNGVSIGQITLPYGTISSDALDAALDWASTAAARQGFAVESTYPRTSAAGASSTLNVTRQSTPAVP